jgi:hypothetical protein
METGQFTSPKYYYIMSISSGTITHGPMNIEEVKEMMRQKFQDNPNFVMVKSKFKHSPGDVVALND